VSSLLELQNLKIFKSKNSQATELNLEIRPGDCLGLWGHRGVGRSILFKFIAGLASKVQSSGALLFEDRNILSWSYRKRSRAGIIYIPRIATVFDRLQIWENLFISEPGIAESVSTQKKLIQRSAIILEKLQM